MCNAVSSLLVVTFFTIVAGLPFKLFAQREPKPLTLDECIVYAREYSASALMARQTFLAA